MECIQKEMRKEFKHFSTKKIKQTQNETVVQEMRDRKAIRHTENK